MPNSKHTLFKSHSLSPDMSHTSIYSQNPYAIDPSSLSISPAPSSPDAETSTDSHTSQPDPTAFDIPSGSWPYAYQATPIYAEPSPYQFSDALLHSHLYTDPTTHTPTTTTTQWSQPSAMYPTNSAPPNTPWGQFSPAGYGYSPMVSSFSTSSLETQAGPIRSGLSRQRSATLMTPYTSSPLTPQSGYYPHPTAYSLGGFKSPLTRRPSAPLLQEAPKRLFHPSPASTALNVNLQHLPESSYSPLYQNLNAKTSPLEIKTPRFRPSKEQLDILIAAYDKNKNPDATTRDALARQLGPDIRPKTLQIWFQNRRSKSRAKDKDTIPKLLPGGPLSRSNSFGKPKIIDVAALRNLVHDDDLIPITVGSISSWTRFLTPGAGLIIPDLAASFVLTPIPQLSLYVVHQTDSFRLTVPLLSGIENLKLEQYHSVNQDAIAISFDLLPGQATFSVWTEIGWGGTRDFTNGEATTGGKCEITGDREVLMPAFAKIQSVYGTPYPTPISTIDHWRDTPITPFPETFKFPAEPSRTNSDGFARSFEHLGHHQRQRSFSTPLPTLGSSMSLNPNLSPDMPDSSLSAELPRSWAVLGSPSLVIPPPEDSPMPPTNWGFPTESLQQVYQPYISEQSSNVERSLSISEESHTGSV